MGGTSYYDGPVMRRLMTWMLLLAAVVVGIVVPPSRADGNLDVNIESLSPQLLDRSQPDQRITMTGTEQHQSDRGKRQRPFLALDQSDHGSRRT